MVMGVHKNWFHGKKLFWVIAGLLALALMTTSCSSKEAASAVAEYNTSSAAARDTAPRASSAPHIDAGLGYGKEVALTSSEAAGTVATDRKIIKDGDVTLETLKFEDSLEALNQLIEKVGGFSETRTIQGRSNSYQGSRSAYYVIRVPAQRFEEVLNSMVTIGTVLEVSDKGTDITEQYMDLETRVKNLRVQEETLLELMAKATKLEDVITLESRISEVRYEIESIENSLRNYDSLVSYSRISINLYEVTERNETMPVPKTLGARISSSFNQSLRNFKNGLEDFLVWLAGAWISLLFMVIVAVAVVLILKKRKKKKQRAQAVVVETPPESRE